MQVKIRRKMHAAGLHIDAGLLNGKMTARLVIANSDAGGKVVTELFLNLRETIAVKDALEKAIGDFVDMAVKEGD